MGRGKVVMKRIDNKVNRQVTFSKRRRGLLKKAHELAVLCDAHLGVLVFSTNGKLQEYCSPHTSWSELIQRRESISNAHLQATNRNDDQDVARLRRERDHLVASHWRMTGEDIPSDTTKEELHDVQQQLERALGKIRQMKDKLLRQQLKESRQKVHILEDQNRHLRHMINEDGQHHAAAEASEPTQPARLFAGFFSEVDEEGFSTSLQLWPQQLPDAQDPVLRAFETHP